MGFGLSITPVICRRDGELRLRLAPLLLQITVVIDCPFSPLFHIITYCSLFRNANAYAAVPIINGRRPSDAEPIFSDNPPQDLEDQPDEIRPIPEFGEQASVAPIPTPLEDDDELFG